MANQNAESTQARANFNGVSVVCFESRMAEVMAQSIERYGGKVVQAPSLKEVPLTSNPAISAFQKKLSEGKIDVLILMTGVGTRMLLDFLSKQDSSGVLIQKLSTLVIVARGPKPARVLKEYQIPISIHVPEPNTWREILEALDLSERSVSLEGRTVAIQEYGIANDLLLTALKKRGARVEQIPVYRWTFPDDTAPLLQAIQKIISGEISIILFTNAAQVRHLIQFASKAGLETPLRAALGRIVISSVGPTTSETILENGLPVDFEPTHPKMGPLISETAAHSKELILAKTTIFSVRKKIENEDAKKGVVIPNPSRVILNEVKDLALRVNSAKDLSLLDSSAILLADKSASPQNDMLFLKACRLEETEVTPIWIMRQAGRYLKEYRDIRNKVSFLELCKNSELCAEVTVLAQEKIKADAAIIFSDLLLPAESLGFELDYSGEEGPVISSDTLNANNADALREINPKESLAFVFEAIRLTRRALSPKIPLLGFSGAPFTLASYLLEGGGSKNFLRTKQLMYRDPGAWHALMQKLSRGLTQFLALQIEAGADAVQIFDSWVGCLSPGDYKTFVLPHTKSVIEGLKKAAPVIHFGTGTAAFLKEMREAGGDVIGVDFRVELDQAWNEMGHDVGIQGNLDPAVLCAGLDEIKSHAKKILCQAAGRKGHIFNLGHGVLPMTPPEHVIALVEYVHQMSRFSPSPYPLPLKGEREAMQAGGEGV